MSSSQEVEAEEVVSRTEVEALREQVRRLTQERAQLSSRLVEEGGSNDGGSAAQGTVPPPTRIVTRFVHLARERKCPLFSGEPGGDALSVDAWITEVRKCWEGQDLTVAEQTLFIQDHLTGNAKAEVEFHPEPERDTPARIFLLLREHFKHPQSYIHALAQFCQRHQRTDETVREFSYAIKRLMDIVERAAPGAVPNADQLLRDQLVEHVRDSALKRLLDQRLATDPFLTFSAVRAAAVKWEDARPAVGRARSQSLGSIETTGSGPTPAAQVAAIRAPDPVPDPRAVSPVAPSTQQQLDELTRLVARLVGRLEATATHPPGTTGHRPARTPDGRPICYQCGGPGHIARFCPRGIPPERRPDPPPAPAADRGPSRPFAAPSRAQAVAGAEAGNAFPLPSLAHGPGEC